MRYANLKRADAFAAIPVYTARTLTHPSVATQDQASAMQPKIRTFPA
jgi:hypothetical protein